MLEFDVKLECELGFFFLSLFWVRFVSGRFGWLVRGWVGLGLLLSFDGVSSGSKFGVWVGFWVWGSVGFTSELVIVVRGWSVFVVVLLCSCFGCILFYCC